jgi:hypothetical protein
VVSLMVAVGAVVALCVTSVVAVRAHGDERAFASAAPCAQGQSTDDSCLSQVIATVTAVTEPTGQSSGFQLAVSTGTASLNLSFPYDNLVLGGATDGSTVTLEYWRGTVVAVSGSGATAMTDDAPGSAFGQALGGLLMELGVIGYAWLLAWALVRRGAGIQDRAGPAMSFILILVGLGGLIPLYAGWHLLQNPQEVSGTLSVGLAAVAVPVALAGWAVWAARRRLGRPGSRTAATTAVTVPAGASITARPTRRQRARVAARRPKPAFEKGRLFGIATGLLFGGLLFATLVTLNDGPSMRAYDSAPACAGAVATPTCRGAVPVQVNGVRTTASGGQAVDISFADRTGSVNAWSRFDASTLTGQARQLQASGALLTAQVWQQHVLGVQLDGIMHWSQGNPPNDAFAAGALAVLSALALACNRVRTRLRAPERSTWSGSWLLEDAAQLAGTAGAVWLLADGVGWAVVLLAASLSWSQWSVAQAGAQERRRFLVPALVTPTVVHGPGGATFPERIAALADELLFLDPAAQPVELLVNDWEFLSPRGPGDPLRAGEVAAALEDLAEALRARIAASGRQTVASFYVYPGGSPGELRCCTTSMRRSDFKDNPEFVQRETLTRLVERWLQDADPAANNDSTWPMWLREIGTVL